MVTKGFGRSSSAARKGRKDDAKIRHFAGADIIEVFEDVSGGRAAHGEKLDRRTLAIEQILPTLATKDDLKAFATKDDLKAYLTRIEMEEKFEEAKHFALVLHEDLKRDLALIAEHVVDLMTRLPRSGPA